MKDNYVYYHQPLERQTLIATDDTSFRTRSSCSLTLAIDSRAPKCLHFAHTRRSTPLLWADTLLLIACADIGDTQQRQATPQAS